MVPQMASGADVLGVLPELWLVAGALVVLLTWVYYAATIVLVGAELTHGLSLARGEPVRPQPQADKTDDTHPPG